MATRQIRNIRETNLPEDEVATVENRPVGAIVGKVNRSRLGNVQPWGNYTKEQALWVRIFTYRLLMIEQMDRSTLGSYLSVSQHQMRAWTEDIDNQMSLFAQELVQDMAANPEKYSRPALVERLSDLGLSIGRPPKSIPTEFVPEGCETRSSKFETHMTPDGVAERWLKSLPPEVMEVLMDDSRPVIKGKELMTVEEKVAAVLPTRDIGTLILTYLSVSLETLAIQAMFMRDEKWLRSQRAGELAQLHTAMTAHTLKIVEAMAVAQSGLSVQNPDLGPSRDDEAPIDGEFA